MKCPILMAYALISKNYFGNLFQWRNAKRITDMGKHGTRVYLETIRGRYHKARRATRKSDGGIPRD